MNFLKRLWKLREIKRPLTLLQMIIYIVTSFAYRDQLNQLKNLHCIGPATKHPLH